MTTLAQPPVTATVDLGPSAFPHTVIVIGSTPTDTLHLPVRRTVIADLVADLDALSLDDGRVGTIVAGDDVGQWCEPDTRQSDDVMLHVDVIGGDDPLTPARVAMLVLVRLAERTTYQQAGDLIPNLTRTRAFDWGIALPLLPQDG